uniref:Uncharacterized protein n=1 Tax=Anopheles melas TaxID=34690 RepID=A0A182U736_9DIPT
MEIGRTTNNLPHSEFSGRCRLSANVPRKMASASDGGRLRPSVLLTLLAAVLLAPTVYAQRPLGNSTFGASHNSSGVINAHPVLTTSTTTTTETPRSVLPASASGFEDSFEDDSSDLEEHEHHDEHHDHEHHLHHHYEHHDGGESGHGSFPHPNGEMNAGASRNGGHDGAPIGSRQPGSRLINPYFPTPASTQGGSKTTEPQNRRPFNPARPGRGRKTSPINELRKLSKISTTNMNGLDSGGEPISYGSTTHRRGQTVHHGGANAYGQESAGGAAGSSAGSGSEAGRGGAGGGGGGGGTVLQGGRGAADYGNRGRSDPGRGVGVLMQSPGYYTSGSSYSRQGDDPLRTLRARYNEEVSCPA